MTTHLSIVVLFLAVLSVLVLPGIQAASEKKPHPHTGKLTPYTGKHLPYSVTAEEAAKLEQGGYVNKLRRDGDKGGGFIVQDIEAPPHVVMGRIRDLKNYYKMVPNQKSVTVTTETTDPSTGIVTTDATLKVGVSVVTLTFFIRLTFDPHHNTVTWLQDYSKSSDLDDNAGHWQAVPHPTKGPKWTRLVYSTDLVLFSWIPEFVVNHLTKTALVSSSTWVKKYSEEYMRTGKAVDGSTAVTGEPFVGPDLSPCFTKAADGAEQYTTDCADGPAPAQVRGGGGGGGGDGSEEEKSRNEL